MTKKYKKMKSASKHSSRLESKLQHYWKRGLYGEFVTLYTRNIERAKNSNAAQYLESAVYNLLTGTLFQEQNFVLLQEILSTLDQIPDLSQENIACLNLARQAYNLTQGNLDTEQIRQLPEDIPQPYLKLRDRLLSIRDEIEKSPLEDYLQGKIKRTRKGEKCYSRAVRLWTQLRELQQLGLKTQSTTPFTQLKNTLQELQDSLLESGGISSNVLEDGILLGNMLKDLVAAPYYFKSLDCCKYLKQKGFSFCRHHLVLCLLNTIQEAGELYIGKGWGINLGIQMFSTYPELMPPLPDYMQNQLGHLQKTFWENKNKAKQTDIIDSLLKGDVWTPRERYFLLLAKLQNYHDQSLDEEEDSLNSFHNKNKKKTLGEDIALNSTQTLLDLVYLKEELGFPHTGLPEDEFGLWEQTLQSLPVSKCREKLLEVTDFIVSRQFGTRRYLFLIHLSLGIEWSDKNLIYQRIQNQTPNLFLKKSDIPQLIQLVYANCHEAELVQYWSDQLPAEQMKQLAEELIWDAYNHASNDEMVFLGCKKEFWFTLPRDLLSTLRGFLDEDFPLMGLLLLTLQFDPDETPLPQKANQAKVFLNHLPPPSILYPMLLWMLTWPQNKYSPNFLYKLIREVADYATQNQGWFNLVKKVLEYDLDTLASKIWNLWSELNLFESLARDQDFEYARQYLNLEFEGQSRNKKNPGKKKKGKNMSTEEIFLEEFLKEVFESFDPYKRRK